MNKPEELNPFSVLNIKSEKEARSKFLYLLTHSNENQKPKICLAFDMICNKSKYNIKNGIYTPKKKDEFYYTNIGDLKGLQYLFRIKKDQKKLNEGDSLNRTLLYLAARNGYYDIVKYLIKIGVDLNKTQKNGSTPLHGAAFYGNKSIVKLLIENGCNPYIKNNYGNQAESEASDDSIKKIIIDSYNNKILNLYHSLYLEGKVSNFVPIEKDGKIICFKLICKSNFNHHQKYNYEVVWHGTKFKNLKSIVYNGLKPAGAKILDDSIIIPPSGHIPLDITFNGIKNWAKAVFVSPSFTYSSLPSYAEKITCNSQEWVCLVEGRVKKGKFTRHKSTTNLWEHINSEPTYLEYRVAMTENDNYDTLFVTSIVFISMDFLKNVEDYQDTDTITETSEENVLLSTSLWADNIETIQ